jgi:predicted RNase H-like HicB family nuclease
MVWYNDDMKKDIAYRMVVEEKDGVYVSSFPSLPGCHTWGKTFEEAIKNAEEALALYIETLVANGDRIPVETATDESVSLGLVVRTPATA